MSVANPNPICERCGQERRAAGRFPGVCFRCDVNLAREEVHRAPKVVLPLLKCQVQRKSKDNQSET